MRRLNSTGAGTTGGKFKTIAMASSRQTETHEMFKPNFDILGGQTLDEWLEEEDEKDNAKPSRHVTLTGEELDTLEKCRFEPNTTKSTSWAVNCFRDYIQNKKQYVDFATIKKEDLNNILRDFYGSARNSKGKQYAISSYVGLRAGINRYLNDPPLSRAWCIMKDSEFTTSNNVFNGLVKSLRRSGMYVFQCYLSCKKGLQCKQV